VLFSGLPALVMAEGRWPSLRLAAWTLFGTALAAGAANALNSYLERERDARMARTATRPLVAGTLAPERALWLGLVLSVLGTGVLWIAAGPAPAGIALAAILFYVFVYTLWLKPRTPFAVIAGGVSGAIAPLIADAAADGHVSAAGWLLFAIIFLWQPPHFYAIAMNHRADYARAGFPMLFDRIGDTARRRSLVWIASPARDAAPVWLGMLGPGYGAAPPRSGRGSSRAVALLRRHAHGHGAPHVPRLARLPDGDVRGDARRSRRAERGVRRAFAALVAAAFLAACGDSQKTSAPPASGPAPAAPQQTPPAAPAPTPAPSPAANVPSGNLRGDAQNGARLYAQYCASCHGPKGHGDGPVVGTLNPKPANHTDHVFMAAKTDEHLYQVISQGGASVGKSPMMAPWGGVIPDQGIRDLIAFLRQISST
jgi:protoheme IX farnesyltransferase